MYNVLPENANGYASLAELASLPSTMDRMQAVLGCVGRYNLCPNRSASVLVEELVGLCMSLNSNDLSGSARSIWHIVSSLQELAESRLFQIVDVCKFLLFGTLNSLSVDALCGPSDCSVPVSKSHADAFSLHSVPCAARGGRSPVFLKTQVLARGLMQALGLLSGARILDKDEFLARAISIDSQLADGQEGGSCVPWFLAGYCTYHIGMSEQARREADGESFAANLVPPSWLSDLLTLGPLVCTDSVIKSPLKDVVSLCVNGMVESFSTTDDVDGILRTLNSFLRNNVPIHIVHRLLKKCTSLPFLDAEQGLRLSSLVLNSLRSASASGQGSVLVDLLFRVLPADSGCRFFIYDSLIREYQAQARSGAEVAGSQAYVRKLLKRVVKDAEQGDATSRNMGGLLAAAAASDPVGVAVEISEALARPFNYNLVELYVQSTAAFPTVAVEVLLCALVARSRAFMQLARPCFSSLEGSREPWAVNLLEAIGRIVRLHVERLHVERAVRRVENKKTWESTATGSDTSESFVDALLQYVTRVLSSGSFELNENVFALFLLETLVQWCSLSPQLHEALSHVQISQTDLFLASEEKQIEILLSKSAESDRHIGTVVNGAFRMTLARYASDLGSGLVQLNRSLVVDSASVNSAMELTGHAAARCFASLSDSILVLWERIDNSERLRMSLDSDVGSNSSRDSSRSDIPAGANGSDLESHIRAVFRSTRDAVRIARFVKTLESELPNSIVSSVVAFLPTSGDRQVRCVAMFLFELLRDGPNKEALLEITQRYLRQTFTVMGVVPDENSTRDSALVGSVPYLWRRNFLNLVSGFLQADSFSELVFGDLLPEVAASVSKIAAGSERDLKVLATSVLRKMGKSHLVQSQAGSRESEAESGPEADTNSEPASNEAEPASTQAEHESHETERASRGTPSDKIEPLTDSSDRAEESVSRKPVSGDESDRMSETSQSKEIADPVSLTLSLDSTERNSKSSGSPRSAKLPRVESGISSESSSAKKPRVEVPPQSTRANSASSAVSASITGQTSSSLKLSDYSSKPAESAGSRIKPAPVREREASPIRRVNRVSAKPESSTVRAESTARPEPASSDSNNVISRKRDVNGGSGAGSRRDSRR